MKIIYKNDLDNYRYIVAKVVFLNTYNSEFTEIIDIPYSNCFIAKYKSKKVIVSLLRQPILHKKKIQLPIVVFYEKKQSGNQIYETHILDKDFKERFDEAIGTAFFNPIQFITHAQNSGIDIAEFLTIFITAKDTSGSVYKYYSTSIEKSKTSHGIPLGKISFMHPKTFNDPFDCTCLFADGTSATDRFRVFCSIPDNKNILMWSYYGDNHKGYCFEYSKHAIITELLSMDLDGLCIVGEVKYDDYRPNYRLKSNTLSYTNLKDLIMCTFTKYKEWKHEKEFRFVIISDDFRDGGIATQITVPIVNIFRGCKNEGKDIEEISKKPLISYKLTEDYLNYKLK